jgi:hypothetical protein
MTLEAGFSGTEGEVRDPGAVMVEAGKLGGGPLGTVTGPAVEAGFLATRSGARTSPETARMPWAN